MAVEGNLLNARAISVDGYDQGRYVLNVQLAGWTERDGDCHDFLAPIQFLNFQRIAS